MEQPATSSTTPADTTACVAEDTLLAFVEGRVAREERRRIERHIGECAACSELVATAASTWLHEGKIAPPAESVPATSATAFQALGKGTMLGRYRIAELLGAGAMGQVYRARDTQLDRDVAVKVVASALAADPVWLRRFDQEARAAGMLNHPNVLAIHDVGSHEGVPYLVSELLQGETLRVRLGRAKKPIPRETVMDWALQIARGLTAAHDAGIVHRDLKPENVFLTRAGQVKILDFGLAKLSERATDESGLSDPLTVPGAVIGTVGYMSPEQVRGLPADNRADLFALGAILYEIAARKRAFDGATAVERMHAILKADPAPLGRADLEDLAPVIAHCLEKDPSNRYQSARDLAFYLKQLSPAEAKRAAQAPTRRTHGMLLGAASAVAVLGTSVAVGVFGSDVGENLRVCLSGVYRSAQGPIATRESAREPVYHPITFRRGHVLTARFTRDGHTILYGAVWDTELPAIFMTRTERPDSLPLPIPSADLLAISSQDELLVSLYRHHLEGLNSSGTLARVPLQGGTPRSIIHDVQEADWDPEGTEFCVVRAHGSHFRLEYPPGHVLYDTGGWISHARFSPKGDWIAFLDHPNRKDDRGSVRIVDRNGLLRTLSTDWSSTEGLAWSPNGDEVWFTAAARGGNNALWAVDLDGRPRMVTRAPGRLVLHDISEQGTILIAQDTTRLRMMFQPDLHLYHVGAMPDSWPISEARELTWSDASMVMAMSTDTRMLLFAEVGEQEGESYGVYLRRTDGSPAARLGDGMPLALSPDRQSAVAMVYGSQPQVSLLPTGPGNASRLGGDTIALVDWARWLPDGRGLVLSGRDPSGGAGLWVHDLISGAARVLNTESMMSGAVSPDGSQIAAIDAGGKLRLIPISGGAAETLPGDFSDRLILDFSPDGGSLYLRSASTPTRVSRLGLAAWRQSGGRANPNDTVGNEASRVLYEIPATRAAGLVSVLSVVISPDANSYAYTYQEAFSRLYVADWP